MTETSERSPAEETGRDAGKRLLTIFFMIMGLALIFTALIPTVFAYRALVSHNASPIWWCFSTIVSIAVFAYAYAVALLVLRFIVPVPKEGIFPMGPNVAPSRDIFLTTLNILLTRLRYNPPWSQMLTTAIVNTFPLGPLYRRYFGPHNESMTIGETIRPLDPYLTYIGKNVQFGFEACITCHVFDNRGMIVKRVVVEDNAMVGALSCLMAGVRVGHHAVVATGSVVKPFTEIKPYEFWGGVPARKLKDLDPSKVEGELNEANNAEQLDAGDTQGGLNEATSGKP